MNQTIGRINLTRSQSDEHIVSMLATQRFLIAQWRRGEPIVYGFGASEWAATNTARRSDAPQDVELFTQLPGETFVWQSPSGKRITIEHLLTIDA